MAETPQDPDRDDDGNPAQNPFAGTPMEQIFQALGGQGGQGPDLAAVFGQMQRMFSSTSEGPVDFTMAKEVARHALAAAGPDPTPHSGQQGALDDAVRLAEMWLDRATDVPAATVRSAAWSRAEWIEGTAETWQQLVEPIAESVVAAMGEAIPEEAKAMAGPLIGLLNQAGGAMFAQQIGQALAGLAGEVLSSTDVGIPLSQDGSTAAVLPTNVAAFGEGLEHSAADVLLYVTLRECAHLRLFRHAAWLRPALVGAIAEFGRGTRIDVSAIESQLQGLDPSRPDQISEALSGGLFEPQRTPEQQVALDRLETLLAFVEGWVDDVVAQATRETMPAAPALAEAVRRRRATGGPAEQTFASLVGLELRPRRMREAATLWAAVRDRRGAEQRDAVWNHPDLMPTAADLDDPMGFATGDDAGSGDADFDAALGELLGSVEAEADETPDDER